MLFLIAFRTKAAVFRLFFWFQRRTNTPPAAVSASLPGATKVGVYALIRVVHVVVVSDTDFHTHVTALNAH